VRKRQKPFPSAALRRKRLFQAIKDEVPWDVGRLLQQPAAQRYPSTIHGGPDHLHQFPDGPGVIGKLKILAILPEGDASLDFVRKEGLEELLKS